MVSPLSSATSCSQPAAASSSFRSRLSIIFNPAPRPSPRPRPTRPNGRRRAKAQQIFVFQFSTHHTDTRSITTLKPSIRDDDPSLLSYHIPIRLSCRSRHDRQIPNPDGWMDDPPGQPPHRHTDQEICVLFIVG